MTKSPSRTPTRKAANATTGSPKLTKRQMYQKALAHVAMAKKPELMSPKESKDYQKAKNLIAEHEASVAAANRGSVPFVTSPQRKKTAVTSPRRKKTVVTHDSSLLSPPNHKYPGMTHKVVQHYGSPSNTIAFDMTMNYGEEGFEEGVGDEEEIFHSAKKMASPMFHVASKTHHNHEPKALFHERYPDQAQMDEDLKVWWTITWKYMWHFPKAVLAIIAVFLFYNMSTLSLFVLFFFF